MSEDYFRWSKSRLWVLLITSVSLISLIGPRGPRMEAGPKPQAIEARQIPKALSNSNTPPQFVHVPGSRFPLPLFPRNYDWKEQERVDNALAKLYEDTKTEDWEALVINAHDTNYCLTVLHKGEVGENHSVGYFCGQLAFVRLIDVYYQHLPPSGRLDGSRRELSIGISVKDLPAWRKKRKEKLLYELQIEVCELALRSLKGYKYSPTKQRIVQRKIQAEIIKLKTTKRPVLHKYSGFLEPIDLYSPELAKRIREKIERTKARQGAKKGKGDS